MAQKKHLAAKQLAVVACLAFSACSIAQTGFPAHHQTVQIAQPQSAKSAPAPAQPANPVPLPAPATAPSLLDHPAQPATVSLASGKLTVQANNSSLSDILHQVATAGGMKIEGLQTGNNADQRIFGSYGPGAPRDVLSELLNGSGYNVLMLGETSSGTPRELTLTARNSAAVSAPAQAPNTAQNENDEDNFQPTQYNDEQQNLTPPPGPPEMRNGARTPQQMLQELQRMHEQQQQQQQEQQQDDQPN
jgi:hypothetical protein